MKPVIKFIIAVAIPLTVGSISGYVTSSSVDNWFTTINKPSFNPPNWLFAPVWTTLYILMGISLYLVWQKNATHSKTRAILMFGIQLFLNFLWSIIFFGLHEPGWAFVDIVVLLFSIILTIVEFRKLSKAAAWLLLPYILWVAFATALNFAIWRLNVE